MLFSPNSFLQRLQRELEMSLFNEKTTFTVITNLYKRFCSFIQGCDKIETEQVKLLAHCCLQYIECIQNHVHNTRIYGKAHLESLKEFIGVIGDAANLEGVKEAYLICITVPIFEKIVEPDMKLWFAKELLKNFNLAVQGSRRNIRQAIVENHQLYFCKLADTICTCGDYDYQVLLLEAIFRMCSEAQINQYAHELFPTSDEFKNGLCHISKDHFDKDVRNFLNIVNSTLKKVLSLKCEIAQLGRINIAAPRDPEQSELFLWADFNLGSKTITIICDKDSLRTDSVSGNVVEDYEIITINVEDIDDVLMSRIRVPESPTSVGFMISFKMIAPCSVMYPSSVAATRATQLVLAIYDCPELNELVENVLPHWFGEKFKSLSQSGATSSLKTKSKEWGSFTHGVVYKPLEIAETPARNLSISGPSSRDAPKASNLKPKSAAPLKIHFASRKVYKPLETEDAPIRSRPASAASNKSSTSDAMSLKEKLRKHQGEAFVRTEKDRISKSPNIRNVEELKEKAANPELALLAKKQEENRKLAVQEKSVLSVTEQQEESVGDASDDIFVENENIDQAEIKPRRCISVAKQKEIIKVKWAWPKRFSISRPTPANTSETFEEADVASSNKASSSNIDETSTSKMLKKKNKDKHKQMRKGVNEYLTIRQSLDSSENGTTPFLPCSENSEPIKEGKNSKLNKTNKTKASNIKQTRKSTRLDQMAKSKEIETPINTELTHSEQPSTLQVLISGVPCGDSTKNTEEVLFDLQGYGLCELVEDIAEKPHGTTNDASEVVTGDLKFEQKTLKQFNENKVENSSKDREYALRKPEVQLIDLTCEESFELGETADVDVNIESDGQNNEDPKSEKIVEVNTEKGGSSDVVESSQLEENIVQIHQPEEEIVDKTCKSKKLTRPPKKNRRETVKKAKIGKLQAKAHEGLEDLLTNEPSEDSKTDHAEVSKDQYEEKATNDEDGFKISDATIAPLSKEKSLNEEKEDKNEETSTKDQKQAKANKIPVSTSKKDSLNESVNEERPYQIERSQKNIPPHGNIEGQIDTEAIFDLLLEEYKTSHSESNTNTTIEELLNKEAFEEESSKANEENINEVSKKNNEKDEQSESYNVLEKVLTKEPVKEYILKDEMETNDDQRKVEEQICPDQEEHSSDKFVKERRSSKKGKTLKKTPGKTTKDHFPSLDKVTQSTTCSEKFPKNTKSSKNDKISHKRKNKMETKRDCPNVEQLSKKVNSSSKSKNFEGKTTDEDHSKILDIVEEIPKETSSQEFFEEAKLNKKIKMSQKKRKSEMEPINRISQRNASSRKDSEEKKTKKSPSKNEKKIIDNVVAEQLQHEQIEPTNVQEENISTIKTTQMERFVRQTSEDQGLPQSTVEKKLIPVVVMVRQRFPLPGDSSDGERVQNQIIETVEKFQSKTDNVKRFVRQTSEDQGLPQSTVEKKLIPVVVMVRQRFPLPGDSSDGERVQNQIIETVEKFQSKTDNVKINEDQALLQITSQENRKVLPLSDSSDDGRVQNEECLPTIEKVQSKRVKINEDRVLLQGTAQENRKVLPLPDSSDDEQVQNEVCVPMIEKVQSKSEKINEEQVLLQSTAQENRKVLPLPDSSDDEQLQNDECVPTIEKVQSKRVKINEDQVLLQSTAETNLTPIVVDRKKRKLLPLPDSTDDEQTQSKKSATIEKTDITKTAEGKHHDTLSSSKKRKLQTLSGSFKEQHQSKELEENALPTAVQSKTDTIETIDIIETNEGQLSLQNSESKKKTFSPLPYGSNEEQPQKQDAQMEQEEERMPSIETIEPDKIFDELLQESAVKENLPEAAQSKKRKLLQDNSDNELPKKKTKWATKTDQAEKINKTKGKRDGTDLKKVKNVQIKRRKLYNLNDTSYFNEEDQSNIRQDLSDELPIGEGQKQKKVTSFINIEESPATFNDPLLIGTLLNEDQNLEENQRALKKPEKLTINLYGKDEKTKEKPIIEDQNHQIVPNAPGLKKETPTKDKSSLLTFTKPQRKPLIEQDQNHNEIQSHFKEPEKSRETVKTIERFDQDQNNHKIEKPSIDHENEFKKPGDIPVQNQKRLEKLVIHKVQNLSSHSSKKSCKEEEYEKQNKQRRSWDCERSNRTNPFESVTLTRAHLKSPKRLERKSEFDMFIKSLETTMKLYDGTINDSKRRNGHKNDGNRKNNRERKFEKLNSYNKQPKPRRVKQMKGKNTANYDKEFPTQESELYVENKVIKTTVIELLDSDEETDQVLQVNTEATSKVPAKKTENRRDDVCLARQNLRKENSLTIVIPETIENEANADMEEEYYPVSPLDPPEKSVRSHENIQTCIDGVTIIQELQKLERKVCNIESVVLDIQKMWMELKHSKSTT